MKLLATSSEVSEKQFYFMCRKQRGIDPAYRTGRLKTASGGLKRK